MRSELDAIKRNNTVSIGGTAASCTDDRCTRDRLSGFGIFDRYSNVARLFVQLQRDGLAVVGGSDCRRTGGTGISVSRSRCSIGAELHIRECVRIGRSRLSTAGDLYIGNQFKGITVNGFHGNTTGCNLRMAVERNS